MKYKKIIGLSIFLASAISFVACANKSEPHTIIENNNDVYEDHSPNPTANDGYCLITFDGNGGTFQSGSETTYFQARKGHNWKRIKDKLNIPLDASDDAKWKTRPAANMKFKFWKTADNKSIFDEYVFNEDNITLTAKWGEEYRPSVFSTDSWGQVIEAADKGYDELKARYIDSQGGLGDSFIIKDPGDPDEVAAKTRYVEIEGLKNPITSDGKWPVHVIGENHDLIKDSPKAAAALTFEFSYAPIPSIGWDYSTSKGHQSWEKSSLRDYLNSYFYLQFEDELQSGIQTIRKNVDDGTNQDNILTLDEKIFIPSVSEVADPETLNRNGMPTSYYENTRYQYYVDASHYAAKLIKTNPFVLDEDDKPTPVVSWLRSPYLNPEITYNDDSQAMAITPTTSPYIEEELVNVSHAVCPCFAIGENPVCGVVANVDDGLTFETKEGFAKAGTNYDTRIKVNDTFGGYRVPVSLEGKITITDKDGKVKILTIEDDYTYDNAQGILTIKGSAISDNSSLIIINLSPDMDKLNAAPWSEVVEVANSGIVLFKKYFDYEESANLAGIKKYLTIDGVKYRTQIIGETYDPLSDGTGTATLTFEFIDAVGGPGVYDDQTNTNFPESQLNFRLSSFAQDKMPFELQEVRKPITTKTDDEWNLTYYDTKLFPISTAEMGESGGEVDEQEWYEKAYDNYPDFYHTYYRYLPGTQTTIPVWYRTPNANDWEVISAGNNALSLNEEGRISYDTKCTDSKYVAPCFCIGRDSIMSNVTFSGATDSFTIDDVEPHTITAPIGQQLKIEKIAAKEVGGVTPEISKDNITITNNGDLFEDWDLISYGGNDYDIVINRLPSGGVNINVTFPSECLTVSLDPSLPNSSMIRFEKGTEAPDTSLVYSTNGLNFEPYTYGVDLPLTDLTSKLYFKAAPGANNMHFADVDDFSDISPDRITMFMAMPDGDDAHIRIEGNIMSLLGDGHTIPTTIDANSAFTGMFRYDMYVYDASGLVLPATGTSNDTFEAKGTYAGMFYACENLVKAPAKITGFNDYGEEKVTDTYNSMFLGTAIESMPYCDFSKTCPRMCKSMFQYCAKLYDTNNVITDKFNYDYSESCFEAMFNQIGSAAQNNIEFPDSIGSPEVDAAKNCCKNMFSSCANDNRTPAKAPNMMCKRPDQGAFQECFRDCKWLTEAAITVREISSGSNPYEKFLQISGYYPPYARTVIQHLYIYGLADLEVWPTTDFNNWLDGRADDGGTLYANANVINAITVSRTASSLPEGWLTAIL